MVDIKKRLRFLEEQRDKAFFMNPETVAEIQKAIEEARNAVEAGENNDNSAEEIEKYRKVMEELRKAYTND